MRKSAELNMEPKHYWKKMIDSDEVGTDVNGYCY